MILQPRYDRVLALFDELHDNGIQLAWILVVAFWIRWFLRRSGGPVRQMLRPPWPKK